MRMVERVAREICKNAGHVTDRHWQHYTNAARAAIEAMREPDDEMAKAGIAAWEKSPMAVVTQFRAMIDKAIQDSGE